MKILQVSKRVIDPKDLLKRGALDEDSSIVIDSPTIVKEWDTVIAILDLLPVSVEPLTKAVKTIKFWTNKRTGWLLSTSKIFWYKPRNPIRGNFCTATALHRDNKKAHSVVCSYAKHLDALYNKYLPEWYKDHKEQVSEVLEDWKIKWSVFTSWIINKNNPLKYHYDTGNFNGVFSNMITLKKDIDWGHLIMPEYDLIFKLPNWSVMMFDWQSILHWVSPIRKTTKDAYRYTAVFYSLKSMRKCLEPTQETLRIKQNQTKLYRERLDYMKNKDNPDIWDIENIDSDDTLWNLTTTVWK